jgi:hypothetical protein
MTNEKKYAIDMAKEITIAHLNNANPTSPCKETGVCVGEMFEEIYNKIFSLISNQQ